jgi:hypothetical protein
LWVGCSISKFLILPFIISKLRTPPATAPPGFIDPAPRSKFPPPVLIPPPPVSIAPPVKSRLAPLFKLRVEPSNVKLASPLINPEVPVAVNI